MLLQLLELCWSLISHVGSSRNTRMPIDEILRRVQKYTFWISIFIFLPVKLVAGWNLRNTTHSFLAETYIFIRESEF